MPKEEETRPVQELLARAELHLRVRMAEMLRGRIERDRLAPRSSDLTFNFQLPHLLEGLAVRADPRAILHLIKLAQEVEQMYGEGRIAHIMYRHNGHPVSVFMLPKTSRAEALVDVMGHEAAVWSIGDRTFVLIAREPRGEVQRMASFVHAGLR